MNAPHVTGMPDQVFSGRDESHAIWLLAAHYELKGEDGGIIAILDSCVGVGARQQHVDIVLVGLLDPAVCVEEFLVIARPNDLHQGTSLSRILYLLDMQQLMHPQHLDRR